MEWIQNMDTVKLTPGVGITHVGSQQRYHHRCGNAGGARVQENAELLSTVVSADSREIEQPLKTVLDLNYPNPFNPTTVVSCQ